MTDGTSLAMEAGAGVEQREPWKIPPTTDTHAGPSQQASAAGQTGVRSARFRPGAVEIELTNGAAVRLPRVMGEGILRRSAGGHGEAAGFASPDFSPNQVHWG